MRIGDHLHAGRRFRARPRWPRRAASAVVSPAGGVTGMSARCCFAGGGNLKGLRPRLRFPARRADPAAVRPPPWPRWPAPTTCTLRAVGLGNIATGSGRLTATGGHHRQRPHALAFARGRRSGNAPAAPARWARRPPSAAARTCATGGVSASPISIWSSTGRRRRRAASPASRLRVRLRRPAPPFEFDG